MTFHNPAAIYYLPL